MTKAFRLSLSCLLVLMAVVSGATLSGPAYRVAAAAQQENPPEANRSTANTTALHPIHTATFGDVKTGKCLQLFGDVVVTGACGQRSAEWSYRGHTDLVTLVEYRGIYCLDSNSSGHVYIHGCNGGDYQKWRLSAKLTMVNHATSRCLDSNDRGEVYTLRCNGGDYQRWLRHPTNG